MAEQQREKRACEETQSKGSCFIPITAWRRDELNGEPQFHVPFLSGATCLMCVA